MTLTTHARTHVCVFISRWPRAAAAVVYCQTRAIWRRYCRSVRVDKKEQCSFPFFISRQSFCFDASGVIELLKNVKSTSDVSFGNCHYSDTVTHTCCQFTLNAAAAVCVDYLFVASFQSPMRLKAHLPFCRRRRRRRRVLFSFTSSSAGTRIRNRFKRLMGGGGLDGGPFEVESSNEKCSSSRALKSVSSFSSSSFPCCCWWWHIRGSTTQHHLPSLSLCAVLVWSRDVSTLKKRVLSPFLLLLLLLFFLISTWPRLYECIVLLRER